MRHWGRPFLLVVLAFGALAAACGDDDRDTASGSGTGTGSASGVAACEPVGSGGTELAVTLDEWSVTLAEDSAAAGLIRFAGDNEGDEAHELVIVRAESADDLPVEAGKVAEDGLANGAFVGEIEAFPAGETCEGSFELAAGTYVLFCNIVEKEEGGELESHFQQGMHTTLRVQA